jgi:endonuclease/exonuclease/phosphatase family metal-dependent hydrolase
MWKWVPPSGLEGTVVLIHGFDRRNYDDSTRRTLFRRVRETVQRREGARHHQRTILAGDFNAQPFDSAMAAADGLHAIGVRSVRTSASRAVRGAASAIDFFYNPMWRAYGQQPQSEAGAATHYWLGQWVHELGWHMLDQVVFRPGESPRFPEDQIRIITQVGSVPLVTLDGLPDSQTASDHLPVVFHWNL